LKYLLTLLFTLTLLWSDATPTDMSPYGVDERHYMHINILDQQLLSYDMIDEYKFSEISDAAFDASAKKLYLLGDQGVLFAFDAKFEEKISSLRPIHAKKLVQRRNKSFKKWEQDSEGMTISSSGELLISFEGSAKIGRFDTKGVLQKQLSLPLKLKNPKNFRSRNKSLESVASHPKYGILTAAEWPLKKNHIKEQAIYALDGKEWHFRAEEATNSAVVGIEVMDDGNLLVLERAYSGMMHPVVITLKKVWLEGCQKESNCRSEVIASFNTADGWHIDNFEGLARVGKNRYIMVSDDNDNFYQRTLLVYFEIIGASPKAQ